MQSPEIKVIKHSAAVGVVGSTSLLQRRAWNVMLAEAYDELPSKERYAIPVAELIDRLSITTRNTDHLKSVLGGLVETRLQWDVLGRDSKRRWGIMPMLSEARIEEGMVHYAFPPTLREWLYNPSVYARISLAISNRFNSRFSLAVYELAVDYLGVGQTPWIDLADFRLLMGIEKAQYRRFGELNRNVVQVAEEEINEHSDIEVRFEKRTEGRKVTGLKLWSKARKETPAARVEAAKVAGGSRALVAEAVAETPDAYELWFNALSALERSAFEHEAEGIVQVQHPEARPMSRKAFVGMTMRELWKERTTQQD